MQSMGARFHSTLHLNEGETPMPGTAALESILAENRRRHARRKRDHAMAVSLIGLVGLAFTFHVGGDRFELPHTIWDCLILLGSVVFLGGLGTAGLIVGAGILWGVCYLYVSSLSRFICDHRIRFEHQPPCEIDVWTGD
jgi:hypothetical protein